jgi:uncharacterized UPF0160 family protein
MLFTRRKLLVTHNGSFHADDVFACATLAYYFEKKKQKYRIVRTRDQEIINSADIVVDVGAIHDPAMLRFDHHQSGGAGERENGIPYAAFGLVWSHFGEELCESKEIADEIDRRLVQPIDAIDNGISISDAGECGLRDYGIHGIVGAYQCTWKQAGEHDEQDNRFLELVEFFKGVIAREIEQNKHRLEIVQLIEEIYEKSERKVILEVPYHANIGPLMQVLESHPEVLYIVARSNSNWKALALRKEACSFESRANFPKSWAGKRNEELEQMTGVSGALFCHNALFMAVATSKEGAWQLAELALAEHNKQNDGASAQVLPELSTFES